MKIESHRHRVMLYASIVALSLPTDGVVAQSASPPAPPFQQNQDATSRGTDGLSPVARTAKSANGRVGERSSLAADLDAPSPMARIDNRVRNRVENRLRNRIDEFYDPRANATSPFVVAAAQSRKSGGNRRR